MLLDASIIKGIIAGFILSLPFGPVGIYCMEVTIVEGRWKGYVSALVMVSIDVLYGIIALVFVNRVEDIIIRYERYLTVLIGIFLILIAIRKLTQPVTIKRVKHEFKTLLQGYFTFMFFALANISSIAVIILIFTTLRVFESESSTMLYQVPMGIFAGGASLWFFTTTVLCKLRKTVEEKSLIRVSRVASYLILLLGVYLIFKMAVNI